MNETIRLDRHTWTKSLCLITGAEIYCPFATCAEVIADRWSVLILRDIAICNQRTFRSILANSVEKISSGVLAGRVRRQGFWHQELRKLRECPAHLVGFIMRRAVCDASVALRVSFV